MRLIYVLIVSVLSIIVGCSDDQDILTEKYDHCLPPVRSILDGIDNCSAIINIPNADACDFEKFSEYQLSDKTKSYMSLFCLSIGDTLTYKSNQDKIAHFVIDNQNYQTIRTWARTDEKCHPDSSFYIHLCYDSELASVQMKSLDLELGIWMNCRVVLSHNDPRSEKIYDVLSISNTGSGIGMRYVIDQRPFDSDFNDPNEFYNSLILNGIEYYDVVVSEDANEFHYKYYFNKEYGIVGFENQEGKLWTLRK